MHSSKSPAILENKAYDEPSVFLPENLLREARRQRNLKQCDVPAVCVLDPDGDLCTYLVAEAQAQKNDCWACYHSLMYTFHIDGMEIGIIPNIVGASYAVLVAEQLFVSGCQYLISVTSAGIINMPSTEKRFALLSEAIRDEGTSYHYLAKGVPSTIDKLMFQALDDSSSAGIWFTAKSWTTDAPYRETKSCISIMKGNGVTCVEMEAAALYAFAKAKEKNVICFAHLTNTMAQEEGDFEKGKHFGSIETLNLLKQVLIKLNLK